MFPSEVRWSKLAGVNGLDGSIKDALASASTSAILPLARLEPLPLVFSIFQDIYLLSFSFVQIKRISELTIQFLQHYWYIENGESVDCHYSKRSCCCSQFTVQSLQSRKLSDRFQARSSRFINSWRIWDLAFDTFVRSDKGKYSTWHESHHFDFPQLHVTATWM